MMAKSVYKTVIFGAGQIGQMTARLLSSPCQLLCFADNDREVRSPSHLW